MSRLTMHTDCRHYRTDRPCNPHKRHGYVCPSCPSYDAIATRILIVKLDAIGDVLRTTSLLQPLHAAFPSAHVTWLTRREAVEVLRPNRFIDEVVPFDHEAIPLLLNQPFDIVINPDASITSCRLAALAKAPDRRGFSLHASGQIRPLNPEAELWYELGQNDKLKKENVRTYQSILIGMAGLPLTDHPIIWEVADAEATFAQEFARRNHLVAAAGPRIGLNTGAGGRWRWKKWTQQSYVGLIQAITATYPEARILLYGGPDERDRNAALSELAPGKLVDTGVDNSLREFGALVSLCDIMVTGDTMALHVATALTKRVVALFGPTSADEIEMYGRGAKVTPSDMPCLGCYLSDCDVSPACMERISVSQVMSALIAQIHGLSDVNRIP